MAIENLSGCPGPRLNRCGVGISATKRAFRIGPMQGIWRSSFAASCFRLSAKNSGRRFRGKACIHPAVDRVAPRGGVPRLAESPAMPDANRVAGRSGSAPPPRCFISSRID
jgi:hypothetical protein